MESKVSDSRPCLKEEDEKPAEYKVYGIRWVTLFLFVMYSTSNAFQWTQLVIISNILENYYQVTTLAVSWTSMIYMVTYIPLIFPASWFLQKKVLIWLPSSIWSINKQSLFRAFGFLSYSAPLGLVLDPGSKFSPLLELIFPSCLLDKQS